MTKIVAFIGPDGAGKSTTANKFKELVRAKGMKAEVISLATPLKVIAAKNCGYKEELKREGHRDILLKLGMDIRTELGDSVFAYACLDKISDMSVDYAIIDDMRWFIEADIIGAFNELYILKISGTEEQESFKKFEKELSDNRFTIYAVPHYSQGDSVPILLELFDEFEG